MSKKLYKVVHAIMVDRVYKVDEVVALSEERAAAFGPKYVVPTGAIDGEVVEPTTEPETETSEENGRREELDLMTVGELKAHIDATYEDVDYKGLKKAELVDLVLELEAKAE